MKIAEEGKATVDGRIFNAGAIKWRKPPMPLMFIRANDPSGRGGHKTSEAVGTITDVWREENEEGFGRVYGRGYFSSDEMGQNARQLIEEGVISGVSADVGGAVVEELELDDEELAEDGAPRISKRIISGEIVAVTCLPIPAFDDMKISSEAVTASSAPASWQPPAEWFENPNLEGPTPLTVTADGRVYGHVAAWGTCHVGYKDRCVTPPRSNTGYQFFNVGQVLTADGKTVNVGRITAGTGHASLEFGAQPAVEHYDHTGWAAAYVSSGEDSHGIWVSGAVSPNATEEQIATLRAASISGDWRSVQGNLEMVGVLAVNSPGFPVPRTKAGLVAGAQVSLVAAGLVKGKKDCGCGCKGAGNCGDKEELEINMGDDEPVEIIEVEEADAEEVEEASEEASEETEEVTEDVNFDDVLARWDRDMLFPASL